MKKLLSLILLCSATTALASWSDQIGGSANEGSGSNSASTTLVCTLTNNPTAGNFVWVGFNYGNTRSVSSVKDSGMPQTTYALTSAQGGAVAADCNSNRGICTDSAFLAVAPGTATKTITITLSGNSTGTAWCKEFSGGAASPFDKNAAAGSMTAVTSIALPSLTPTSANKLLFGMASGSGTMAASSGWTAWASAAGAAAAEWRIQSGGPSIQTVNFTQSNSQYASSEAAFSAAASFTPETNVKKKKLRAAGIIP